VAIASIMPMPPGQVDFANVCDVLDDFLSHVAQVGFQSIQPCPFGEAYVQFVNVRDRDRLIRESPIPFDDVMVSFTKHNEGVNWRRALFNRECWLMLVGVPFDHWNTEDLSAAFNKTSRVARALARLASYLLMFSI
jgi:hypothetical protein